MATWDITAPAGSGVGDGGTASASVGTVPGDFDGATIDDVSVVGTPSLNSDGTTDDTIEIRWQIQQTGGTETYGDFDSSFGITRALCAAQLGVSVSSATIADQNPFIAPTTAVAADWDEVAYNCVYTKNGKDDNETVSWSAFTIRVTYTPAGIEGTLAETLGALTASATGKVDVDGSLSETLGSLTAAGTGDVDVTGTLSETLGALTSAGTGAVDVDGSLAETLGTLTLAGTGTVAAPSTEGSLNETLGTLTSAATGEVDVTGSLIKTLGTLSAAGAGTVDIDGQLSETLGTLTSAATGDVDIDGSLSETLGAVTLAGTGTVTNPDERTATLNETLGSLTSAGTGEVDVAGGLNETLGALTVSGAAQTDIDGYLTATLGPLTSAGMGAVAVTAALSETLGSLTVSGLAVGGSVNAALNVTLGTLSVSGTAQTFKPQAYDLLEGDFKAMMGIDRRQKRLRKGRGRRRSYRQ